MSESNFRDRDNAAILFPNFGKKQPKHPDFTGTGIINGKKYKLSAWKKQGKRTEFFSIAFTDDVPKTETARTEQPAGASGEAEKPKDDDIPF